VIDDDYSRVWRKKYGELWSTDDGDIDVESYSPRSTLSENDISPCCAPKFLLAVEND